MPTVVPRAVHLSLQAHGCVDDEAFLESQLGEEVLSGEGKVADLWSVRTAEEAVGKFG